MTKVEFKAAISDGLERSRVYMVVKIETEGNPAPEVIVNPIENVPEKMAYYEKAYNEDMELITAKSAGKSIRIIDAIMTNNLNDLNWFIY